MNELIQYENFLPLILMYIIIGLSVSARFYYAMIENKYNYKTYHIILAAVFNFLLWPFKMLQVLGLFMFDKLMKP